MGADQQVKRTSNQIVGERMKQQSGFVTTVAKTEVTVKYTFHFMPSWESQIPSIPYMGTIIGVSANCTQSHIMYYIKCAVGFSSPEGRMNPLAMSLTHMILWLAKVREKPWLLEGCVLGFPCSCAQQGLEGEELSWEVTLICPIAGGSLLACLRLSNSVSIDWPFN